VALYSYTSGVAGDLVFNQGDVITLIQTEGDWWTGMKDNQTGIFPANYVKKMETSTKVLFCSLVMTNMLVFVPDSVLIVYFQSDCGYRTMHYYSDWGN
jgi:SH3 domain